MSPFKRVYWFLGRVVISKSNLAFVLMKDAASTQRFIKKFISSFNYQTNWSKMNLKYMYPTFVVSELCPLIIRKMTSLNVSK